MSERFTGKAISKSVSMPEDMWALFERRRAAIGVPISRQIQDLIESAIEIEQVEPARTLVDSKEPYDAMPKVR